MAITTQLVGKLGGGGLKWSSQSFPQRTMKWDGTSATETIALPAGKDVVAYFVCEVISGPHAYSRADAVSREMAGYRNRSSSSASLPAVGKHTSGLFRTHEKYKQPRFRYYCRNCEQRSDDDVQNHRLLGRNINLTT